jgi:hypothetical protein
LNEPPAPVVEEEVSAAATPSPQIEATPRVGLLAATTFGLALLLLLAFYVALNAPGAWFPTASTTQWPARDLTITRGTATLAGGELLVTAPGDDNTAIVSLTTAIRASDYAAINWIATNVPENADVRLLWRSDYAPQKLNFAKVGVESGRLLPAVVANDPGWLGRITGLALIVRTPLAQPLRIAGVEAKPLGALEIVRDRAGEWFALEGWTGTSINTVTGGADVQGLPLPLLIACAVALAAVIAWIWTRYVRRRDVALPVLFAVLFVIGWATLDARWIANLSRQVAITEQQYGDKDWRDKHLAAPDGPLFAFIEKVRTQLPADAARVFVASDAHFFRGRAAYHLYPHNVYADAFRNVMPPPGALRKGDWVVVYQRRGMQYDPGSRQLRWDGQAPVGADMKFSDAGAALFEIR